LFPESFNFNKKKTHPGVDSPTYVIKEKMASDKQLPKAQGNGPLTKITGLPQANFELWGAEAWFSLGAFSIKRTMYVFRNNTNQEITVLNSARLDDTTEAELVRLGPVKYLVRSSYGHGLDDAYYFKKFGCTCWAPAPLSAGGKPSDKWGTITVPYQEYSETNPPACFPGVQVLNIPMANKEQNAEVMLFWPEQKLLHSSDFIQNYDQVGKSVVNG